PPSARVPANPSPAATNHRTGAIPAAVPAAKVPRT
ncbi:hypothetical protein L195_g064637, partial [Trifolium pratense]